MSAVLTGTDLFDMLKVSVKHGGLASNVESARILGFGVSTEN